MDELWQGFGVGLWAIVVIVAFKLLMVKFPIPGLRDIAAFV